jgi:hypothetical protein
MKQRDKNIETFLKYGVSEDIADRLVTAGYTASKVQPASKKDFDKILNSDEVDDLFLKVKRQPIPDDIYERLVKETELHCCFCWNIIEEKPVIIHHIDEYNQTQDNSFNNLIVLCLNHHGEVHTKREISQQNFSKIRLLSQKEKWIEALIEYRKGNRPAPGSETKGSTQNVSNSPNSIITQHQVGDNYQINQVDLKPRLVYFQGDTKPEFNSDTKLYKTLFVFGSQVGITLNNTEIEIHFDCEYENANSGIWGNGMVITGQLDREEDPVKKWYKFKTNFLQANNYMVIEIFSKTILKIQKLETKP